MKRTRLSNKFIESKTDANRTAYNNVIIVRLICKKKKAYVSNLTIRDVTEN